MRKSTTILRISLVLIAFLAVTVTNSAAFQEPNMADYTASPVFTSQSVTPNIMIILDNSGSMNFNAYGTYPGDSGTVVDEPFTGEPYSGKKTFQISSLQDDAEETTGAGSITYYNNGDLDLGGFSVGTNDSVVGLRFQNITIPQGMTIYSAYITFRANVANSEVTNLLIAGEASDNAAPFNTTADNIKNRTATTTTVTWSNVQPWSAGVDYPSASIKDIMQEIVSRPGWASGNAMVFRITGIPGTPNKRDVRAYDTNASTAPRLNVVYGRDPSSTRYYGYFNPDYFYEYINNQFQVKYQKVSYNYTSSVWNVKTMTGAASTLNNTTIVNEKIWDGNWMNWLSMRRVDVLRKVLMGGLATSRTGGGNQVNIGETPAQTSRIYYKDFDSSAFSAVSPYHGNYSYRIEGGYIYIGTTSTTKYNVKVQKDINIEPTDFVDGNLAGILQRVGSRARWGNIWFNNGTGSNQSGGTVEHTIGTNMTTMITDLQNTKMDTWTPLAETFYVAMQYFKQQPPAGGLDYSNSAVPASNLGDDPYYNGSAYVPCAKSFIILLTDGASTKDAMIPSEYKDYDGDKKEFSTCTEDSCNYPNGGSDYLDDLALYARTVDLRSTTVGKNALDGEQNLILYAIHAFDKDPIASTLLRDAARNGGFDDRNGNKKPDLTSEWDKDKDGVPDTFFEASDGYEIEAKLMNAITDILKRASSGTAASVLATNSEGEGNMLQAYFKPLVTNDLDEAHWFGYMHSLWVDSYGKLYEDTNGNLAFDSNDAQITFTTDSDGDTAFIRNGETIKLDSEDDSRLKPIFEVGNLLSKKIPSTRKIFTFIDKNKNGTADETTADVFDNGGELIAFNTTNSSLIKPYLGVRSDTAWGSSGAGLGSTIDTRTSNIITWVRGTDVTGLRNRTINGVTWPLGDIINSTPVTVTRPVERFNLWYGDKSYQQYYDAFKDREGITYVGSNDGMLHAFAAWKYDTTKKQYVRPASAPADEHMGDELWALIHQSVLPHLKWVSQKNYSHTYLVDAKPRIFDAKILPNNTHYASSNGEDNWGTILVMGLNMGAKQISANEDFGDGLGVAERVFYPSYICMDITDPRNPRLLWERAYPNQAMSYSTPIPIKVGDKWFLVFGSGPTAYDGSSTQAGYIYVADMKTGALLRQMGPYDTKAFFSTAASIDKNLNYNVDDVYIGDAYYDQNSWKGSLYKIAVPCSNCEWNDNYNPSQSLGYDSDPSKWYVNKLFDSDRPITAPPSVSVEHFPDFGIDNVWVYFGTGRYIADADKTDANQQYLYGIKDPYFNKRYKGTLMHNYAAAAGKTLTRTDLFAGDEITVTTKGRVLKNGALFGANGDFIALEDEVRNNWDGWYRRLQLNGTSASERMISKPAIFGGIALYPVFTPSTELCKGQGSTNFYGLYYTTGTGYTKQIFDITNPDKITFNYKGQNVTQDVVAVKLKIPMIGCPPPSVGLHTGKESGSTAYLQLSTGVVQLVNVGNAIYSLSTITDWWDRTN